MKLGTNEVDKDELIINLTHTVDRLNSRIDDQRKLLIECRRVLKGALKMCLYFKNYEIKTRITNLLKKLK